MDKETFDLINSIAEKHSNKPFGYLTKNDLKNEIWVICLERLQDFNGGRGELEHYLRTCVKNRLINKFKDITKTVPKPCWTCEFYDKHADPDCVEFGHNKIECLKWYKYQQQVDSRNSLLNASEDMVERYDDFDPIERMSYKDNYELVKSKLDPRFHKDLEDFLSGAHISNQKINKISKEIFRIMNEVSNADTEA